MNKRPADISKAYPAKLSRASNCRIICAAVSCLSAFFSGCKYSDTDNETVSSSPVELSLLMLQATHIKTKTSQSANLPPQEKCPVAEGTRIRLSGPPVLVQSANGTHYRVRIADDGAQFYACPLAEGYLFAEHVRQDIRVVQATPDTRISPAAGNAETPKSNASSMFVWPAEAASLASDFGPRMSTFHEGIDIVPASDSEVRASASGHVLFSGWSEKGYGNLIQLSHPKNFETRYAHQSKLGDMSAGKVVLQGDVIAKSVNIGQSNQHLLHFEIRQNDTPKNPILFLPQREKQP
ncbi:MAG: M23 family metallopeptidase [Proteobacteria bacterium]|nr:M23 family metallopeptidase [Pseudomonadota bacterium]